MGVPLGSGMHLTHCRGGSCQTRVSLETFEKATRLNSTSSFFWGALSSAPNYRGRGRGTTYSVCFGVELALALAVCCVDRLLIGPQGVYFSSLCYARTGYKQAR